MRENDQPTAGDFNRKDQPATDDDFECEECGEPVAVNRRYCSRECYVNARQNPDWEPPPKPMTLDEMKAEMEQVLARLRRYDEEGSS